jgi:hypothetical protein
MNKKSIKKIPYSLNIYKFFRKYYRYYLFVNDYLKFKKQNNPRKSLLKWSERLIKLDEKTTDTKFDPHYLYHPAWAARIIAKTKPDIHIDISSILSFSTIISAFVPTKFYDYRPVKLNLNNLETNYADLLKLPFPDNDLRSVSCMHTIEHIGLGRYGDPINSDGDIIAINELKRVLAPGGNLLVVVPIGMPKIIFNAHRIYSYKNIIEYFSPLTLKDFSLVTDEAQMIISASHKDADQQKYGCGCFWFTK